MAFAVPAGRESACLSYLQYLFAVAVSAQKGTKGIVWDGGCRCCIERENQSEGALFEGS